MKLSNHEKKILSGECFPLKMPRHIHRVRPNRVRAIMTVNKTRFYGPHRATIKEAINDRNELYIKLGHK